MAASHPCDDIWLRREGYRDGVRLDPEKTPVATIASAHMLPWLHLAFSYAIEVESYRDMALSESLSSGVLDQRSDSPSADYV